MKLMAEKVAGIMKWKLELVVGDTWSKENKCAYFNAWKNLPDWFDDGRRTHTQNEPKERKRKNIVRNFFRLNNLCASLIMPDRNGRSQHQLFEIHGVTHTHTLYLL